MFDSAVVVTYLPDLLHGLRVTVLFTVGGLVLGLAIGVLAAVLSLARLRLFHWIVRAYVDFIRGTPLLLQLFILYYVLPSVGLKMSAPVAGILGLGINAGAYLAEIFRAGFEAVPRAHVQAARSLGMSYPTEPERSVFRSVEDLEKAVTHYIPAHNGNPKSFVWAAAAEVIGTKLGLNHPSEPVHQQYLSEFSPSAEPHKVASPDAYP